MSQGEVLAGIFGRRLAGIRRIAGISQGDLAAKLGAAGQNAITRLERGATKGLSFAMLARLQGFCYEQNVSLDWLFWGREPIGTASMSQLVDEVALRTFADVLNEAGVRMSPPKEGGEIDPDDLREAGGILGFLRNTLQFPRYREIATAYRAAVEEGLSRQVDKGALLEVFKHIQEVQRALEALGAGDREEQGK